MAEMGNLLEKIIDSYKKITDLTTIMIGVIGLMGRCF